MQPVVHFEMPIQNADRAKKFYADVFGWKVQQAPGMPYFMATTTQVDEKTQRPTEPGAINGGLFVPDPGQKVTPMVVMSVDKLEPHLENLKRAGGKVVQEPQEIPQMGRYARFQDPEGNLVGLFEPAMPTG